MDIDEVFLEAAAVAIQESTLTLFFADSLSCCRSMDKLSTVI